MGLPVQRERSDVESGTPEPFSPEMLADPYPAYSAMRERGRIQRTAAGHWLVLGYDEVSQLLTDQRFGEAAGRVAASDSRALREKALTVSWGGWTPCSLSTRRSTRASGAL